MDPAESHSNGGHLDRIDLLASAPGWLVGGLAALFLALTVVADWLTGADLQLLIFYLVPIVALTWRFGPGAGWVASIAVAMASLTVGVTSPHTVSAAVSAWNATARLLFLAFVVALVHRQHDTLAQQRSLARRDPMTGLLNRRAFYEDCTRALARARRNTSPTSLLYLDVDGLKALNDREGHEAGDRLLIRVAELLEQSLRETDSLSRLGGDEFAVLLPETGSREARSLVERLAGTMASCADGPVAASMGLVTFREPPTDPEELVRAGDALMYDAKRDRSGLRWTELPAA